MIEKQLAAMRPGFEAKSKHLSEAERDIAWSKIVSDAYAPARSESKDQITQALEQKPYAFENLTSGED